MPPGVERALKDLEDGNCSCDVRVYRSCSVHANIRELRREIEKAFDDGVSAEPGEE